MNDRMRQGWLMLSLEEARVLAYKIPNIKLWPKIDSSPLDLEYIVIQSTDNPDVVEVKLHTGKSELSKETFHFKMAPHVQRLIFDGIPAKGRLQKVALPPPKGKLHKFVG